MSVDFGGVTFDIVRGYPQPLKTRNETWEVPGLDGVGAQTLGQGNARTQMTGVAYLFDNGDFAANNAAADGSTPLHVACLAGHVRPEHHSARERKRARERKQEREKEKAKERAMGGEMRRPIEIEATPD